MSNYAQFLGGGGGGSHTSNPKQLSRLIVQASTLYLRQGTGETASNTAPFFALLPAQLDSNWTADTYKQVLSVSSGSGFVSAMVGPVPSVDGAIITFRVDVDGIVTEYAIPAVPSTARPVLGRVRYRGASATDPRDQFTDVTNNTAGSSMGAGVIGPPVAGSMMVLTPIQCHMSGTGMLRYERSFSLQMKSSVAITATAAAERRCGVLHTVE